VPTAKDRVKEIVESQPDDASYDEILRELAFERMVERGLDDSRAERLVSNEEVRHRIWQRTALSHGTTRRA
jgi:predicted transcriptional regulator